MSKKRASCGLYRKRNRWYLSWYVNGASQNIALVPAGATRATTDEIVARHLRDGIIASGLTAAQIVARRTGNVIRRQEFHSKSTYLNSNDPLPVEFERLIEKFREHNRRRASEKQIGENISRIRRFLRAEKISDLAAVSPATINDFMLTAAGDLAPQTVTNYRNSLSAFFKFLRISGLVQANPVSDISAPPKKLLPPKYLNDREYQQTINLAREQGIEFEVCFALWTGCRRGELMRLACGDVNLKSRQVTLLKTKTKTPRSIPLKKELIDLIERQFAERFAKRDPDGPLFVDQAGQERSGYFWRHSLDDFREQIPAFKIAGTASGAGWHLLRHTFCSRLVQAGVDIKRVQEWAGHRSIQTTLRYAHLAPGYDAGIEKA